MNILNLFPGYKTYIIATGVIMVAVGQALTGDATLGDAVNQIGLALMGVAIRKGIKTDA